MTASGQAHSGTAEAQLEKRIADLATANASIDEQLTLAKTFLAEARDAARSNQHSEWANKLDEGGKAVDAAKRALSGPASPFDEWKECRAAIDRFDKLLADVKKTGYTLIAGGFGLSSLLLGEAGSGLVRISDEGKFAVLTGMVFLIVGLFCYDWMLGRWLGAAVARAEHLEKHHLDFKITSQISAAVSAGRSIWISLFVYSSFWLAAIFLLAAVAPPNWWFGPVLGTIVVGLLILRMSS